MYSLGADVATTVRVASCVCAVCRVSRTVVAGIRVCLGGSIHQWRARHDRKGDWACGVTHYIFDLFDDRLAVLNWVVCYI